MPNHFIHYLSRKIYLHYPEDANDPWFAEFQNPEDGFDKPMYHTTKRQTGVFKEIQNGDTIWLISQLYSPWGVLSPALDAKIDVCEITKDKDGRTRFKAAETSSWFPLADVSTIISKLQTVTGTGKRNLLVSHSAKPIGFYLQNIRKLYSADELINWANYLEKKELNFISYRIKDGTKKAFEQVKLLMSQQKVVFWDRWSLPRRLAERRENVCDSVFESYLENTIKESNIVYGIETPLYGEKGTYSEKEKQIASLSAKYRVIR